MPSSSLSPSVCVLLSKVLVPHLFCSRKPCTLIANASIAMSRHHSLPFMTPRYDPQHSLSSLLLVPPPPTLVPDSPRASSPPRYPHHFLDLAYTLFPPRVPITRFVSLAYSPFFPSSPTTPFSIWTLPAHHYIFPVHFLLLRYASRKYVPLLRATPFLL